jgi:hypothetical protein
MLSLNEQNWPKRCFAKSTSSYGHVVRLAVPKLLLLLLKVMCESVMKVPAACKIYISFILFSRKGCSHGMGFVASVSIPRSISRKSLIVKIYTRREYDYQRATHQNR